MAKYRITAPDGSKFEVTAPDGASEAEVMAYAQSEFAKQPSAAPTPAGEPQWRDMLSNLLPSATRFVGGLKEAITSPVQTIGTVLDAAAGGLRNITPEPLRNVMDKADKAPGSMLTDPQAGVRASKTADAIGQVYKDRYGGADKIKNTLITDPVGAVADVSTVFGLGGAGLKAAGLPGATALNTASRATNPLSLLAPVAKGAGYVGKNALGLTTGVGPENITQAFKAGVSGDKSFMRNLTGDVPLTEVLDEAKRGIANMGRAKSAEYRSNMAAVKQDRTVLSFDAIDKAIADATDMVAFKGQVKNQSAAAAVQKMADDVSEWKSLNPAEFHTPEGLDALKQRLGGVLESLPFEEKTARLAAGKVYASVKQQIEAQAPGYTKVMKDYTQASEKISEIERALSLGGRASQDTAMRKLQSLSRNNVNTNYGNRLDLARTLESDGGVNLLPSISGQAMNSWTARGLGGQAENIATLGLAAFHNPAIGLALPLQSPKAVGASLYGLGRVAGGTRSLLGRANLENPLLGGLLASEAGELGLLDR